MMDDYLLPGVILHEGNTLSSVDNPAFTTDNWQVNQNEYSVRVDGVASFYTCDGNYVEFVSEPGADPGWIKLYPKGQVLVALLHQRMILNFHASSFIYDGKGIMILVLQEPESHLSLRHLLLKEAGSCPMILHL